MPPLGSSRLFGTRMQRLRASKSYAIVLAMIVASFFFAAVAPDSNWSGSTLLLLETATLVIALWTAGLAATGSKLSLALIALSAVTAVALVVWGGSTLSGAVGLLSAALVVAIGLAIVIGVLDQGEINRQAVTGAVCIYLLIGFFYVFVYGAIAAFGHGYLFTQGTDGTRSIRLYFSYVTLATVGYGDYTMAGNLGRTLSVLEALMGQLYLVTVLALLVSRMRPKRSVDKT
jgi:Ion channel